MPEYEIVHQKAHCFYDRYQRKAELQHQTHYCPGCGHGIMHKLAAKAIDELGIQDRTILISPVGCSVFAYYYFDLGNVQAAHGRVPAVATAVKRSHPQSMVIGYQGDGDLAAIGTAEIVHAANRGERISIFFINNAIYGMTGGQMAPTTLVGQNSSTSPWGRRPSNEGFPLHMSELLSTLEAPVYVERVALTDNKNLMKVRKAVRKALQLQRDGDGFTFVEILSPCPTIWKMTPQDARKWIDEKMLSVFPLGVFRDRKPEFTENSVPQVTVSQLLNLEIAEEDLPKSIPAAGQHRDLSINIAGFGGQGVLLLGQILAEMGMRAGLEVSWLPSYGPEMRSGSAHCIVCLNKERIGSPLVDHPDVLIAMNELSLHKFSARVAPKGVILFNNAKLPEGFRCTNAGAFCVPAAEIADSLGTIKATNMVMLGALLELTHALAKETVFAVLKAKVHNLKLLEVDFRAVEAGIEYVRQQPAAANPDHARDNESELTPAR